MLISYVKCMSVNLTMVFLLKCTECAQMDFVSYFNGFKM